jgi:hypothetical protein
MRHLRSFALAILAAGLVFAGCTLYPPITGSGVLVEGTADFESFSFVSAGYGFEVTVIADSEYSVTVTVDDNILEHVRMEREGSELRIGLDPFYSYQDVTLKALVTMPVLNGVELSGTSSLTVVDGASLPPASAFKADVSGASSLMLPQITADIFELELSGASTASLGLTSARARFDVSGASRLTAGGSTGEVLADVSGASEADLKALSGGNGDLELSGASRMWVTLSGHVDAALSGGSTLYYRGGLTWGHLDISGGSQLKTY